MKKLLVPLFLFAALTAFSQGDPVSNFGEATVIGRYDQNAMTILIQHGQGLLFPNPATQGAFNVVYWAWSVHSDPSDDTTAPSSANIGSREIVRVTRIGAGILGTPDTLTIVRAQDGTTATTKNRPNVTYKIMRSWTRKDINDVWTAIATQGSYNPFGIYGQFYNSPINGVRYIGIQSNIGYGIELANTLTEGIFITPTGWVGINVLNPLYQLDVEGQIHAGGGYAGLPPFGDSVAHRLVNMTGFGPGKLLIGTTTGWAVIDSAALAHGGGGGAVTWPAITGNMGLNVDLMDSLNARLRAFLPEGYIYIGGPDDNTPHALPITGDVGLSGVGVTTIQPGAVTNNQLANVSSGTFKGRTSGGTGPVSDLAFSAFYPYLSATSPITYNSGTGTFGFAYGVPWSTAIGGTGATTIAQALDNLFGVSGGANGYGYRSNAGVWSLQPGGGGGGGVTSFGASFPAQFSISVTNPTTTPVLSVNWVNQTSSLVLAGPVSGAPAAPTFRQLGATDLGFQFDTLVAFTPGADSMNVVIANLTTNGYATATPAGAAQTFFAVTTHVWASGSFWIKPQGHEPYSGIKYACHVIVK